MDSGVVIFNRFPAQKAGRRNKRTREGEREPCEGEPTAECQPDLEEKKHLLCVAWGKIRCPFSSPLTLIFLFLSGEEGYR